MPVGRTKPAGASIQVDDDWFKRRFPSKARATSAQLNQARYKIQYNPTIQSQMDRTASTQKKANSNTPTSQYGERLDKIKSWSNKANDLFMRGVQKQKELDAAAKAAREAAEAASLAQQQAGSGQAVISSGSGSARVGPSGKPSGATVGAGSRNLGPTNFRSEIIRRAKSYLGVPYTLGGGHQRNATSPSRGFNGIWGLDCSGLTGIVFRQMGINLPAVANQQTLYGRRTNIRNARPGDLVGWTRGGHVGIYIGGGRIIHAPRPGRTVEIRNIFRGEAIYAVALNLPGD